MEYHSATIQELEALLETDSNGGLSVKKVQRLKEKYGENIVAREQASSAARIFFSQFANPLMGILTIAAGASVLIGEAGDALVIGIAITLNVVVGFIQEWRAETTAQKLREFHTKHSTVIRDGKTQVIDSGELVPGDLIVISSGEQVPADARIVECIDLQIEEAVLTGESLPIHKSTETLPEKTPTTGMSNMAFAGTHIVGGKGKAIVVLTGEDTELGKIASLVTTTEREMTPLQNQIKKLSWFLGFLLVSVTLLATSIGLLYGLTLHQFFSLAVALSVAAVPEGLLITMTVILTIGMRRMFKRKALVRNLLAAETLGSVSVVCADKTGTLTQGKLGLTQIVTSDESFAFGDDKSPSESIMKALELGVLNNDVQETESGLIGDPLEVALINAARSVGAEKEKLGAQNERIAEAPFSAETKFMATVHKGDGGNLLIIKGAVEAVLEHCLDDIENGNSLKNQADNLSSQGLRIIAVASKISSGDVDVQNLPKDCRMQALFCFSDPLRSEAAQTVKTMQEAGVNVVMVTGDHPETAKAIAKNVGLKAQDENLIHGDEISQLSDQQLSERIEKTSIFARIPPHEKIRIVRAWQKHGKPTAMTGDGINDAPALKAADIGVAQGSGSDIAQSIAGIVLLDDNLATIGAAIREGRIIFDNIRKVIVYFLADGFTQIILVTGSILMGLPIPLLPTHILWINVISDGLPSMALTAEPGEEGIMREMPRHKNEPILNMEMKTLIFIIGIFTDIGLFAVYFYLLKAKFPIDHIRTIIFNANAVDSLFYVFATRTLRKSIFETNPFSNMWLIGAVAISFVVQLSLPLLPVIPEILKLVHLNAFEWLIITGLAVTKLVAIEITKMFFRRRVRKG
ncbi:cation-translocating P-type ATPase [Candidatus Dependentiae bacterium]